MNGVGKRGEEIQVQEFSHFVFDVVSNIVFRRCLAPRRPCEQTGTRSASKDRCRIEVASSKQPRWRPFGQPVGFWPSKLYFHALQPTELRVKLELLRLLDEWNGRAVQTNCHMAHIFKSISDVEGPGVFRVRLRGAHCGLGHSALYRAEVRTTCTPHRPLYTQMHLLPYGAVWCHQVGLVHT